MPTSTDSETEPGHSGVIGGVLSALALASLAGGLLLLLDAGMKAAGLVGAVILLWTLGRENLVRENTARRQPVHPDDLAEAGLGPLSCEASPNDLYLDTMKRVLLNLVYHESSTPLWRYAAGSGRCEQIHALDLPSRLRGADYSLNVMTLLGERRLDNLQFCIESILERGIPGDFLEAGAYKGGGCIYMKAVLKAQAATRADREENDRRIFVCDTFASPPRPRHVPGWIVGQLLLLLVAGLASIPGRRWRRTLVRAYSRIQESFPTVQDPSDYLVDVATFFMRHAWANNPIVAAPVVGSSVESVRSHFARFGLLDDGIIFLCGYFADTLPSAPITSLALLRVDGDTYESTMEALRPLYGKLSTGGFCIIDDYFVYEECRKAVHDFRDEFGVQDPIERIDGDGAYWMKGAQSCAAHVG